MSTNGFDSMLQKYSGAPDPTAPPPVAPERIEAIEQKLLTWQTTNKNAAQTLSKQVWEDTDAARRLYEGSRRCVEGPQSAKNKDYLPELHAVADQIDDETALKYDMMFQNGDLFLLAAKDPKDTAKAEATKQIVDHELRVKLANREISLLIARYTKYDYAGLKICYRKEPKYEYERREISGLAYTDDVMLAKGYKSDPIELQNAVLEELARDGYKLIGPGQIDPNTGVPNLLVEAVRETYEDHVYPEAVHPRRLAFSAFNRSAKLQYSIHEFHYWTKHEIKNDQYGFQNIDKLFKAPPTSSGQTEPEPRNASNRSIPNEVSQNFGAYEIVESWSVLPWDEIESEFSPEEIKAFAAKYGFDVLDTRLRRAKWCMFHSTNAMHKLYPNYLWHRDQFPYLIASFVDGDGNLLGQSMMIRLSGPNALLHTFLSYGVNNMKRLLNQSAFIAASAGISDDELKKIEVENGRCQVPGSLDPSEIVNFYQPPDLKDIAFAGIRFAEEKMKAQGVPAVLQGEGKADTATQDVINNRRGQTSVNFAFGRLVDEVVVPAIEMMIGVICARFTTKRRVEIAGENGVLIEKFLSPNEFTNKVTVIPVASFDYADLNNKAQAIIALMNTNRDMLPPPQRQALITLLLQKMRFDQMEIDMIRNSAGNQTDQKQELEAMIAVPYDMEVCPVRPDDNHIEHLMVLQMEMSSKPLLRMAPNVMDHMKKHLIALQMAAEAMQMNAPPPPNGNGGQTKGPAKQISKEQPDDEQGFVKRDAGMNSPADQGMETNAGMTGTGSMPNVQAMVPGAPAGI